MVSKLRYYLRDPDGKRRGKGWYYRRVYKGKLWWSKYSPARDLNLKHDLHKGVGWRWQHTCDRRVTPRGRI